MESKELITIIITNKTLDEVNPVNANFIRTVGELLKENKTDDFTSYLFETTIAKDKSWIIVRKYFTTKEYWIYSISDQENLLNYIKK